MNLPVAIISVIQIPPKTTALKGDFKLNNKNFLSGLGLGIPI